MRKSVQSAELKTRSEESQKPVIDDWYEDWRPVGRGLSYSREQDIIRCNFCKKDLLTFPRSRVLEVMPVFKNWFDSNPSEWETRLIRTPFEVKRIIDSSKNECLCKNEECQVLWIMSGGLV